MQVDDLFRFILAYASGFLTYAKLGFYPDPNPNPVYLGMLAGLTFWPSVLLILFGAWRVKRSLPAA